MGKSDGGQEGLLMIEVKEVINKPTEQDVKQLFTDIFGQAKAVQGCFTDLVDDLAFKQGLTIDHAELTVSPDMITVRLGDYILFHQVKEWVSKV